MSLASDSSMNPLVEKTYSLAELGWSDFFAEHSQLGKKSGLIPARVSLQQKKLYRVLTENGEKKAVIAGKLRHGAGTLADFPAVGDWVMIKIGADNKGVIYEVLPRKTKVSRDTGTRKGRRKITDEQVIVANVDTIFLVVSLNEEFNPNRIDRYLTMILDSSAQPVLILNKADLCDDVAPFLDALQPVVQTAPIHIASARHNSGIEVLEHYLRPGETVALLGSSGVGKSTIINAILGSERFRVAKTAVYKDRGRHATTHRELIVLEGGGLLIDNPGMRALQLWDGEEGATKSFEDIELLAKRCRFNDCKHQNEPECAVLAAIDAGQISEERYTSFIKLKNELAYRSHRENWATRDSSKKRWKQVSKLRREIHDKEDQT